MLNKLFLSGVAASLLALLFIALGPKEGLEALGGVLVAFFALLYHIAIGPFFIVQIFRERRVRPAMAGILAYLAIIYGIGLYVYMVSNDIDDAVRDRIVQFGDPDGHRLREVARQMHREAMMGHVDHMALRRELYALIDAGLSVNERDEKRHPALWYVAAMGDESSVSKLLASGAVTDAPDLYHTTPLIEAVRHGHADAALRLIDAGANPNVADHAGKPALVFAAAEGHEALVKALLDAGAEIDAANYDGSAFANALNVPSLGVLELLLEGGATPSATRNRFPIEVALELNDDALIELLRRYSAAFESPGNGRDPPPFKAISECDLPMFRRYLELGASLDMQNRKGKTLAYQIIRLNTRSCDLNAQRAPMMKALLTAGLSADSVIDEGTPLLVMALYHDRKGVARELLNAGASLVGRYRHRNVAMLAARIGMTDLIDSALATGLDINEWPDGMNTTSALYDAAYGGHLETVGRLFELGAELPNRDILRLNLFRVAAKYPQLLALMLDRHLAGVRSNALDRAVRRGVEGSRNEESVQLLNATDIP